MDIQGQGIASGLLHRVEQEALSQGFALDGLRSITSTN
jgi:GNAT superfamily N-acetyltransferase